MKRQETLEQQSRSDDDLMKGVVNGESGALETIYVRYEQLLRAVISPVMRDESEVDDVIHDVLLQVWQQGDRYNPNDRGLRGLLVTLARRRALDRVRRRTAYRRAQESLQGEIDNPLVNQYGVAENQAQANDLSDLLHRFIGELPEAQREVIDLTFFKGMSQREIASRRHIALGTVKTRLHLAQRKLRNHLLPLQNKI
jgi:RNA polymerase sigma-70 factor (ECF subfamily)